MSDQVRTNLRALGHLSPRWHPTFGHGGHPSGATHPHGPSRYSSQPPRRRRPLPPGAIPFAWRMQVGEHPFGDLLLRITTRAYPGRGQVNRCV